MAGRKRLPTQLKIVKGTQKKERLNPNEPKPEVKIPSAPGFLSDEALKEWGRITKQLLILGLLTELDRTELAMYCQAYGRMIKYEKIVNSVAGGELYKTSTGSIQLSPAMWVLNKAIKQCHMLLTQFGMTPASRSTVSGIKPKGKNENSFSKIANK